MPVSRPLASATRRGSHRLAPGVMIRTGQQALRNSISLGEMRQKWGANTLFPTVLPELKR